LDRTLNGSSVPWTNIPTDNGRKIEGVIQTDAAINLAIPAARCSIPAVKSLVSIPPLWVGKWRECRNRIRDPGRYGPPDRRDLIKYGYVRRPYLGIDAIQLSDYPGDAARRHRPKVLVYSVKQDRLRPLPESAAQVSIYRGRRSFGDDVIVSFDNKEVNTPPNWHCD
jgi:S1-C subfamily serine protease